MTKKIEEKSAQAYIKQSKEQGLWLFGKEM